MSKGFMEELSETVLIHVFGPDTFYKGAQYQKKEAATVLSVYAAERDMGVTGKRGGSF